MSDASVTIEYEEETDLTESERSLNLIRHFLRTIRNGRTEKCKCFKIANDPTFKSIVFLWDGVDSIEIRLTRLGYLLLINNAVVNSGDFTQDMHSDFTEAYDGIIASAKTRFDEILMEERVH